MAQDQPWESYTQAAVLNKRIVPDVISLIDPIDTPFVMWLGLDSARSKFNIRPPAADGRKIEWLMDQYRQLTGSLTVSAASDATELTVADASNFKVGDLIQLPDLAELNSVTALSLTDNTLTVVRDYAGTTAATQQTGVITIETYARIEGAAADQGPLEVVTSAYNNTQIVQKEVKVTGTAQAIEQYGISNSLEYQRQKVVPELMRAIERSFLRVGFRDDGSSSAARVSAGLPYYITSNTTTSARTDLAIATFQNVTYSCHIAGGMVDTMVIHPKTLNTLTNLYNTSSYIRVETTQDSVGMSIDKIVTPYAQYTAIPSIHCKENDIWLLDSRHVGGYTLRPLFEKPLPASGDYEWFEMIGEFSFALKHEDAHGYIQLS
jgi:hypothetical protein